MAEYKLPMTLKGRRVEIRFEAKSDYDAENFADEALLCMDNVHEFRGPMEVSADEVKILS